MIVYATTKNTGPSWNSDPLHLLYLGTSVKEAEEAVPENFQRYQKEEKDWPTPPLRKLACALPRDIDHELVQYYMADGWFYTIVMFKLEEPERALNEATDFLLTSREEGEKVLKAMNDIIHRYGMVTLQDLRELVGLPVTTYKEAKKGWKNINDARVRQVREGFMLDLPEATDIH